MAETKDVLENLRLLKAFLRIKDPTVRRAIVELVERKSTLLTPCPSRGLSDSRCRSLKDNGIDLPRPLPRATC